MKKLLRKERILSLAMFIGAVVTILSSSFACFAADCEKYPDTLFRLHILANSDSDADQSLKYALRDYLLEDFSVIFEGCDDVNSAKNAAKSHLGEITKKAQAFIEAQGYDYKITASVEKTYFTTRKYGDITVPAGEYEGLRILIGDGKGKNWWCVMFPPLCLSAADGVVELSKEEKDNLRFLFKSQVLKTPKPVTLTEEESKKIETGDGVEVRFAMYEWFCSLFN